MKAEELIKKLGFDPTEVEKAEKPDELIEKFHSKQEQEHFELFKNELGAKDLTKETLKGWLKGERDKLLGEFRINLDRHILKIAPDISADELKEMKLGDKLDTVNKVLKDKYSSNKDVKELQEKLIAAENAKKEIQEQAAEKVKQAFLDADKKLVSDRVSLDMKNRFLNIPKEKLLGDKHNEGYYTAISSVMGSKYDLGLGENGETVPFMKGSQQRVTDKKDGKEYFVAVDELILKTADDLGFIKKSNGQGGTPESRKDEPRPQPKPDKIGIDHEDVNNRLKILREKLAS